MPTEPRRALPNRPHRLLAAATALALLASIAAAPTHPVASAPPAPLGAHPTGANPEPAGLAIEGQIGGRVTAVAIAGGHAYLGQGARLVVTSWRPPALPVQLGETPARLERIADIAVRDGLAYVAGGLDGLWVADVSDPAAPRWLGGTPLDEVVDAYGSLRPAALRVAPGDGLVAVTAEEHVQFVDVADPARPRVVSHWRVHPVGGDSPGGDSPRGVAFAGRFAYVAQTEDGLAVLDLADPAVPRQVARLTTVRPRDIAVAGTVAYVALDEPAGLLVLDVRDPADPRPLAQLTLARPPGELWATGGRVYLRHIDAANGLANVLKPSGAVTVVDVTDPADPRALGFHTLGERDAYTTFGFTLGQRDAYTAFGFQGAYALTAGTDGRLSVVEVPDEPALAVAGAYAPWWYDTKELVAADGRLYALDGFGQLQVLDLSTPGEPGPLHTVTPGFAACSLAVDGHYAYLGRRGGGVAVVDMADSAAPRVVGELLAEWTACDLAVEGHLLAVAAGEAGLRVLDVSNPAAPVERTTTPVIASAWTVAMTGGHAYVALDNCSEPGGSGVAVVDLAEPAAPRLVATLAEGLWAYSVVAEDDRLLLMGMETEGRSTILWAFDVAEPARARSVARIALGSDPLHQLNQVDLAWPLAAGVSYDGVVVVDLPRSTEMVLETYNLNWSSPAGIALTDGHAYVGHSGEGYTVVRLPAPGEQPAALSGYTVGDPGTRRVAATATTAYIASGSGTETGVHDTVQVLDVREPARPKHLQTFAAGDAVVDLELAGDWLLALTWRGGEIVLATRPIDPAGTLGPEQVLPMPEGARWIAADGRTAWVFDQGERPAMTAVALTEGAGWSVVARQDLGFVPVAAQVVAGRAFILADGGLQVWDVADPAAPRRLGQLAGSAVWTGGLAVADGWAYAMDRPADPVARRLQVMDVRDPTAPALAARLPLSADVSEARAVVDDRLYLGGEYDQTLAVVDVSTPTAPRLLRTDHLWNVEDMAVAGDRAWLAAGSAGLHGLDLSHAGVVPAATTADWAWSAVTGVARAGDLVAVALGAQGLRLVSFASPDRPVEVGAAPSWVNPAHDVAMVAGYAYVAAGIGGVVVLDVSQPDHPRQVHRAHVSGATQVLAHGSTVFAMGAEGLSVLDARDPASPEIVGQTGARGQLALRADRRLGVTTAGEVIDLADPRNPRQVGEIDLDVPEATATIAIAGSRAYVSSPHEGFAAFDLTDPTAPKHAPTGGLREDGRLWAGAYRLATQGHWLFAALPDGGVAAYDIAQPDDVRFVAELPRGAALEPASDAWRGWPDRPVTALLATPDALLVGGADDGLWWLRRAGALAARWAALLPLAWNGREPPGW